MPSIANQIKRLQEAIESGSLVPAPEETTKPPIPTADPLSNTGSFLRTPLPAVSVQQPDMQRVWHNGAVPQVRLIPPSVTASPVAGAQAASQAAQVVSSTPATTGGVTSVGLTMPSIFVAPVSGSPVTKAGTLAVALTSEPANTVFAGPTSTSGNVNLDIPSSSTGSGTTWSVTGASSSTNDFALLTVPAPPIAGFTSTQPDASWTQIQAIPSGNIGGGVFWKQVSTVGSVSASATFSTSKTWAAAITTVKATGTPAIRQSKNVGSGGTTISASFSSNTLAGSTIFAIIQGNISVNTLGYVPIAVADSQGNQFTRINAIAGLDAVNNASVQTVVFACPSSSAAADTVTASFVFTEPGGTNFGDSSITLLEVTNLGPASFLPIFRPIVLADLPGIPFTQLTANIAVTQINNGTNASASTFLRGDMTWDAVPNFGGVNLQTNDYVPVAGDAGKLIAVNPSAAQTTPIFVQGTSTSTGSGGASLGLAYNSNVSLGHLLLIAFSWGNSSGSNSVTPSTVTDTLGNTWTQVGSTIYTPSSTFGSFGFAVFQTISKKAGANTVTFSISSSQTFLRSEILEYSNPPAGTLVDVSTTNTGTGTALTSGNITTTSNNDLILELATANSGATIAAGAGYTARIGASGGNGVYAQDKTLAVAGTTSFSGTLSVSSDWASMILGIFPESGATVYLPNPPISSTWATLIEAYGGNSVTISRNQLQIDGAASNVALNSGKGAAIFTDGTNYFTFRGGS